MEGPAKTTPQQPVSLVFPSETIQVNSRVKGQRVELTLQDLQAQGGSNRAGHLPPDIVRDLLLRNAQTPIVVLILRSCCLTTLPQELNQLSYLHELDVSNNALTELPIGFVMLTNLVKLNLSGNKFKELPVFIGHLPALLQLQVHGNDLANIPWGALRSGTEAICTYLRSSFIVIEEGQHELEQNVKATFNVDKHADLCFVVEGQRIYAHRLIVAMRIASPILQAMLASPNREHEIAGTSAEMFLRLLKYAYGNGLYDSRAPDHRQFLNLLRTLEVTTFGCNQRVGPTGLVQRQQSLLRQDFDKLFLFMDYTGKMKQGDKFDYSPMLNGNFLKEHNWFADLSIRCADHTFACHKFLLCARSPYFQAKFEGGMADSLDTELVLDQFDEPVVSQMMRFIYTDEAWAEEDTAQDLLEISGLYQLERLRTVAEKFFGDNIDHDNVLSLLHMADHYQAYQLKVFCTSYVLKNRQTILGTRAWWEWGKEHRELQTQLIRLLSASG